jgi:hypothetical protein
MKNLNTEVVCNFKDKEGNELVITGKDAYLTRMDVDVPEPESVHFMNGKSKLIPMNGLITLTLEFKLLKENYILESFMNGFKPKREISKLRVEDCSIEELLFAIRRKIK